MFTKTISIVNDGKGKEVFYISFFRDNKYLYTEHVYSLNAAINLVTSEKYDYMPAQLKRINFDREKHYITFDQNHVYLTETISGDRETVEIINYDWQLIYYDIYMECFVYENGNDIEYKYIGKGVF